MGNPTFRDLRQDIPNWNTDDLVSFQIALKDQINARGEYHSRKTHAIQPTRIQNNKKL